MKQGYNFVLPIKRCQRTGATDLTFTLPGMPGEFFLQLPGYTAYELRCYTLQAAFLNSPYKGVLGTGIAFPTVPDGKARIRTIMTATHTGEELDRALEVLKRVGKQMGIVQ